ncbi:MAG: hypothetical protein ACSHYB_11965 [Roseibacillus sp.]
MKYRPLRLIGFPLLGLSSGLAFGQEIESTEISGDSMRVRIKAPQVEIERINPDGTTTTEVTADEQQRIIELDVPMDDPTKLFRAKVKVGDQEFGSTVKQLIEKGTVPDTRKTRPSSLSLNGNALTIQFPPNHSEVEDNEFFPQGFPIFLEGQRVQMMPTTIPGGFSGTLPDGVSQNFKEELNTSLERLRNNGDGTVPVYMGRQLTGHFTVPTQADLGDNFDLFPFTNGGDIQPVVIPGAPIMGSAAAVDPAKSLVITDLTVVEDPDRTWDAFTNTGTPGGTWTFQFLMEQLCNQPMTGLDPKLFARRWIDHFETTQVINFDTVPPRGGAVQADIIEKWETRNIAMGLDPLDLQNAPFRLTAIVNRVDLRSGSGYTSGDAGEARFVFCAYDLDTGAHLPMTVIFEYGVPLSGCRQIKQWAQQWQALTSDSLGSPTFNPALEDLMLFVSLANSDSSKPNGSALNQLRSNNFLGGPWTMREWQITGSGVAPNDLTEVTTKQTPAAIKNNTTDLANYINTFEPDILAGAHTVPLSFPGATPFLAGKSEVPPFVWSATGISNNDARHCFSLNTCSGCHGGEAGAFNAPIPPFVPATTGSIGFVHISERDQGSESHLSGFLTGSGMPINDPVPPFVPRTFDDLTRRAADLDFAANMPCLMLALAPPMVASH